MTHHDPGEIGHRLRIDGDQPVGGRRLLNRAQINHIVGVAVGVEVVGLEHDRMIEPIRIDVARLAHSSRSSTNRGPVCPLRRVRSEPSTNSSFNGY